MPTSSLVPDVPEVGIPGPGAGPSSSLASIPESSFFGPPHDPEEGVIEIGKAGFVTYETRQTKLSLKAIFVRDPEQQIGAGFRNPKGDISNQPAAKNLASILQSI